MEQSIGSFLRLGNKILELVSRHNSIHILVLLSSNVQSSLLSRREREGTVWVLLCVGLLAAGGIWIGRIRIIATKLCHHSPWSHSHDTIYQITLHPSLGYINQLVAPLFLAAVNSEPAAEPIKTNFYKNLPLVRRVPIFSLVTECNRWVPGVCSCVSRPNHPSARN